MGADKQGTEHRLEMLRQLKEKYNQPDPPEVLKNKQAKADIYQQILRAESPPDDPELCLDCWVYHGERLKMVAHDSTEYGIDIFRCANDHERRAKHK
jgi:hypothetical protein